MILELSDWEGCGRIMGMEEGTGKKNEVREGEGVVVEEFSQPRELVLDGMSEREVEFFRRSVL